MKKKKQIMVVTPSLSTFIENDITILSTKYSIKLNTYDWNNKKRIPIYIVHQFFFLARNIGSVNRILVEFGGFWSLLPTLFGKLFNVPVFIVLHGTDCASIPSENYGSLRKSWQRLIYKNSYKLATKLLPVSTSLVSTNDDYRVGFEKQGFKYFFPDVKTPYQVIHNGVDEDFWSTSDKDFVKEENSFIAVFSASQFLLKGGDLIIAMADKFKNCKFYIAGMESPDNKTNQFDNIFFLGSLSKEELKEYYLKSQFHFQLSVFEGFGLALCEAMLCECIPIGSSVNIIPEIIGGTGFILKERNLGLLEKIIEEAISIENKVEKGRVARLQIISNYRFEVRSRELLKVIDEF